MVHLPVAPHLLAFQIVHHLNDLKILRQIYTCQGQATMMTPATDGGYSGGYNLHKKTQPIGPCLPDDRVPTEGRVCGMHICSMACVVCVALNLDHGTTRRCAGMTKLSDHTWRTIRAAMLQLKNQRASTHAVGRSRARPGALLVLAMRV